MSYIGHFITDTTSEVLEQMTLEMLVERVFQPSRSPFAFLALLVNKNDGSWHFCVDYRALNTITEQMDVPYL